MHINKQAVKDPIAELPLMGKASSAKIWPCICLSLEKYTSD